MWTQRRPVLTAALLLSGRWVAGVFVLYLIDGIFSPRSQGWGARNEPMLSDCSRTENRPEWVSSASESVRVGFYEHLSLPLVLESAGTWVAGAWHYSLSDCDEDAAVPNSSSATNALLLTGASIAIEHAELRKVPAPSVLWPIDVTSAVVSNSGFSHSARPAPGEP